MLYLQGEAVRMKTRILMRDGLFYISNGNASKIMEFTGYGDILSLYYNPDQNPEPFLLRQTTEEEQELTNRRAYPYPFQELGEIGVTSDNMLLVEDKVSKVQEEYDQDIRAMLNRVVLRFDEEGRYVDYLGQEGIGGTPFPYIHSIQVTARDQIVVISRSVEHWLVFWYTKNGSLLYRATISRNKLPVPENSELLPSLGTVTADVDEHLLYLKVDYYGSADAESEASGSENAKKTVAFQKSRIWWYNLEQEEFSGYVDIPKKIEEFQLSEFEESEKVNKLYSFIGNSQGNVFFLMTHNKNELFELVMLLRDGSVLNRSYIEIPEKKVEYRDFNLSHTGVLSALLVREYSADVVWWRTDKILEARDEDR